MDLQELVEANRRGRSLGQLARDSGLAKQVWAYLVTPDAYSRRMPEQPTVPKIAHALGVQPGAIMDAIKESWGFADAASPSVLEQNLPGREILDRLTVEDVEVIRRMIVLLVERGSVTAAVTAAATGKGSAGVRHGAGDGAGRELAATA
jgi:hypothetical protein